MKITSKVTNPAFIEVSIQDGESLHNFKSTSFNQEAIYGTVELLFHQLFMGRHSAPEVLSNACKDNLTYEMVDELIYLLTKANSK